MATSTTKFDLTSTLYAGVGVTDLAVEIIRDYVADMQAKARREAIENRVAELQDEAKSLPGKVQAAFGENVATATEAYADLAKRGEVLLGRIRRQDSTKATVKTAATTTAKAKTTRTQAAKAAKSTQSTAKTEADKNTTAAKKATKSAAKRANTSVKKTADTAKKASGTPTSSVKATATAAQKTVGNATTAAAQAAEKVGD